MLLLFMLLMLVLAYGCYCWCNSNIPPGQANLLQELTQRTNLLLASLRRRHPNDPRTLALVSKWQGKIWPTSKPDPQDVAYTVNKTHLYMCTHSPSTGAPNDINSAMHVLLHELSHIATAEMHHTKSFWENANFLMTEAHEAGLYQPIAEGSMFCDKALRVAS